MDKFRWCFIGCGRLANTVASQILKNGKHEIVSCYTRNFDNAVKFAKKYNSTAYNNALDAINDKRVDAVYIVVTHNVHYKFTKMALESKKPVFCEKSFMMNSIESNEIINLAKKNNCYLAEAMWTWFASPANQVKEWLEKGLIGKVKDVKFNYHLRSINFAPRVSDPARGGGALLDVTVYPITYAYRLFGKPLRIESNGTIWNNVDTNEIIKMYYKDFNVLIDSSLMDFKGLEHMEIIGEKGTIYTGLFHMGTKVSYKLNDGSKYTYKGYKGLILPYTDEFDKVAEEIKQGLKESKYVSLKHTQDVMELLDLVMEQINLKYDSLEE